MQDRMGGGRKSKRVIDDYSESASEGEPGYTYSLMPDTKSPFSCCCICYRYLLDTCMILALAPFVINCFIEATIILVKFNWKYITWGRSIIAILAVSMWLGLAAFGILCCIAVVKKGVFTRRLRQKRNDHIDAEHQRDNSRTDVTPSERDGSMA